MTGRVCEACQGPLPTQHGKRRFCSERCRKAQYAGRCVDCGTQTNGYDGPGQASERCVPCRKGYDARTAREHIIARIQEWERIYGRPPTAYEWKPNMARKHGQHEAARRFKDANGYWPWTTGVSQFFGSWNAAIRAAGFTPLRPGQWVDDSTPRRQERAHRRAA